VNAQRILAGAIASAAIIACATESTERFADVASEAKTKPGERDCFPSCPQADYDDLVKDGIPDACATLRKGWEKAVPPDWPGWDDDKPICIGFKDEIKGRTDCNRLVDAPGWTACKNELMLVCAREKQPGFNKIIFVPPEGGFPEARKPPSITDQEQACIKKWKCPLQKPPRKPPTKPPKKKDALAPAAVAVCHGDECPTAECDDSWVEEASQPERAPDAGPSTSVDVPVPIPLPTL